MNNFAINTYRVHSAPKIYKDNFKHLQKPCPIVTSGDSFEYTSCQLPSGSRNYALVDKNKIEKLLDNLLSVCYSDEVINYYNKLCNYYSNIDKKASNFYKKELKKIL